VNNKYKYYNGKFIIIFIITFQISSEIVAQDSLQSKNNVLFGFDKQIINTIYFNDINYQLPLGNGNLLFQNNYDAEHYTNVDNFKEYVNMNLSYATAYKQVNYSISNFLNYNSNNADNSGLTNKLENLLLLGLSYHYNKDNLVFIQSGVENKSQIQTNSLGSYTKTKIQLSKNNLYSYNIKTNFDAYSSKHSFNRSNYQINSKSSLSKEVSPTDNFRVFFNYREDNIDFLRTINLDKNELNIKKENRNDNYSTIIATFNTILFNNFYSNFDVSYTDRNVLSELELINIETNEKTNKKLLNTKLNNNTKYQTDDIQSIFGFEYQFDKLTNTIINNNNNPISIEKAKRSDNISSYTNFFFNIDFTNKLDTFAFKLNFEKFTYDSPSEKIDDDRDEITVKFDFSYKRFLSRFLKGGIRSQLWMKHYVYIKSQQSASNRWNRIINFNPNFEYTSKYIEYYPELEIIANYTIYDFETNLSNYSNREINYKDSIKVNLSNKIYIYSNISYRYFIDGLLNWDNFSEKVVKTNLDYIFKTSLAYKYNKNVFKLGFRLYNQTRTDEILKSINANAYEYKISTIGPETSIEFNFINYKFLLSGWLEYKFINDKFIDYNSYLYINSYIRL